MKRPQAPSLLPLALLAASCIFGEKAIQDAATDQDVITTPDMTTSSPDQGEPDADIPDADLPDDSLPDSGAPDLDMPADMPVVCETGGTPFNNVCFYPESCEALAQTFAQNNAAPPPDGAHPLFVRGNSARRWTGHCVGMATPQPKTYLSLSSRALKANTTTIWPLVNDGERAGITVTYTKIRVVPAANGLLVDLYDDAFSDPPLNLPNGRKIYAHTTNCNPNAQSGFNVDLGGTPFKIKTPLAIHNKGEVSVDGVLTDVETAGTFELRRLEVSLSSGASNCAAAGPASLINAYNGDNPPQLGLHLPLVYEPRDN